MSHISAVVRSALGAGASVALKAAWVAYGTAVNAQLAASLMVAAAVPTAVQAAIATDLMTLNTARAAITTAATPTVSADAETKAMMQFAASVKAHAMLLTTAGVTDARATAFLNATLTISAAGGAG